MMQSDAINLIYILFIIINYAHEELTVMIICSCFYQAQESGFQVQF